MPFTKTRFRRFPFDGPTVEGKIIEISGDLPEHVRVELHLESDDDEPVVLLLAPSALTAA